MGPGRNQYTLVVTRITLRKGSGRVTVRVTWATDILRMGLSPGAFV